MRRRSRLLALGLGAVGLGAAVAATAVLAFGGSSGAHVSASVRSRLGLFSLDSKTAPDFTLTDQRGQAVSMASLRGRVVVLDFMDPACTDICPIVSREFVDAARILGPRAAQATFLAVNVNQYHAGVRDVATFSRRHGLDGLPSWHFVTGPTPSLKAVWKAYGVAVVPNRSGDVVHSSLLYFVDRSGRMRYLAWPDKEKGTGIAEWGRGIASVVETLL